jgi:hypothetical protein
MSPVDVSAPDAHVIRGGDDDLEAAVRTRLRE